MQAPQCREYGKGKVIFTVHRLILLNFELFQNSISLFKLWSVKKFSGYIIRACSSVPRTLLLHYQPTINNNVANLNIFNKIQWDFYKRVSTLTKVLLTCSLVVTSLHILGCAGLKRAHYLQITALHVHMKRRRDENVGVHVETLYDITTKL